MILSMQSLENSKIFFQARVKHLKFKHLKHKIGPHYIDMYDAVENKINKDGSITFTYDSFPSKIVIKDDNIWLGNLAKFMRQHKISEIR